MSIRDSSQFASALLMCADHGGWEVEVIDANADESPYVVMTEQMIPTYRTPIDHQIEGDASSASTSRRSRGTEPSSRSTSGS